MTKEQMGSMVSGVFENDSVSMERRRWICWKFKLELGDFCTVVALSVESCCREMKINLEK
jgi:hypothetical protein